MAEIANKRQVAIQVSGVKKMYKLGQIGGGTLQADLQSWWAKKRGKEDPNSKIGEGERSHGKTFMALNGVDLTIYQGEAIGIIGSNGAGKSTLLKLLSRVTAPTEGDIDIYGRIASMLEVGTGFNGELTGRENVYMNGAILGMTKAEIDAKMEQIIEFSEVREFIDTPVKRYSSGMFVKLAFSVAAHLDAEIIIMDEVLAVGDMAFQKKCLTKMREAAKQDGRTVLYVSHNMNTIRQLCDKCIVLDKGKIIFEGEVDKAIGVYMNSYDDRRVSYDYSNLIRSVNESRIIEMCGLDILDTQDNVFFIGDEIKYSLHCVTNNSGSNIGFRLEIFYSDGNVIGTSFLNKQLSFVKGDTFDLIMRFPTNHFTTGKYKCVALFYEYDDLGNQVGIDRVDPAFCFELINKDSHDLVWLHQYWGHVRFDSIILEEISKDV